MLDTFGGALDVIDDLRPEWMVQALCKRHPEVEFFPGRGESLDGAKNICRRCPVREQCLDYALATNQEHGIWGGESERERRRLRRKRGLIRPRPARDPNFA